VLWGGVSWGGFGGGGGFLFWGGGGVIVGWGGGGKGTRGSKQSNNTNPQAQRPTPLMSFHSLGRRGGKKTGLSVKGEGRRGGGGLKSIKKRRLGSSFAKKEIGQERRGSVRRREAPKNANIEESLHQPRDASKKITNVGRREESGSQRYLQHKQKKSTRGFLKVIQRQVGRTFQAAE